MEAVLSASILPPMKRIRFEKQDIPDLETNQSRSSRGQGKGSRMQKIDSRGTRCCGANLARISWPHRENQMLDVISMEIW
jgi:hypothetical protein